MATPTTTERRLDSLDAEVVARAGACTALLGAAAVHATVVAEHYQLWPLAGIFFLALQVVQAALAVGVAARWTPVVASLVVVSSVAAVGVWGLARTVGVPVGPAELRAAEAVGRPDLACVALQVLAALLVLPWAALPWAERRSRRHRPRGVRRTSSRPTWTTMAVAAAVVVGAVAVSAWGLGPAVSGEDHDHASTGDHAPGRG